MALAYPVDNRDWNYSEICILWLHTFPNSQEACTRRVYVAMTESLDSAVAALLRKYALQNALEYDGKGQVGSVMGRVMGENPDLRQMGKQLTPHIQIAVDEANALANSEGLDAIRGILEAESPDVLVKKVKQRREGLPPLPNATDGAVVLRFAPNPNGPLSFGHARGVVINAELAKAHGGEVILRFDDTDAKIKRPMLEAYKSIEEDYQWLAGRPADRIIIASDRMPVYLEHAKQMLKKNFGYVCSCTPEDFREHRQAQTECTCRARDSEENLRLWELMNAGEISPGQAVVRVKTDMELANPALRDWPALRIQHEDHPRVGDSYKVWPLLDFQSAVEDHLQGVTHIVRGKDLMDSTRKQVLLYEHFGWEYPETLYWGRVKVHEFGGFSTSAMKEDIAAGKYQGWDDPRLPTIAALRRRGYDADAMRKFWVELGLNQKDISVPMSLLNSINAKTIDATTPRLTFVAGGQRLTIDCNTSLSGEALPTVANPPTHPEYPELGVRNWPLCEGGMLEVLVVAENLAEARARGDVRLKDFVDLDLSSEVARIRAVARVDSTPIIHWLPVDYSKPATLLMADQEELVEVAGFVEINDHTIGEVVQLERVGFARIESIDDDGIFRLIHLHG